MRSQRCRNLLAGVMLVIPAMFGTAVDAQDGGGDIKPGASVDGLRMEARAILVESKGGKELVVHAMLVNTAADELTVLTKLPGPSTGRDATGVVVEFNFTGREKMNGRLLIPSIVPNEPVTLRREEAAKLFARRVTGKQVEGLKDGEEIRIGYLVSEEWGRRFGLWHGYVCALVPVKVMPSE